MRGVLNVHKRIMLQNKFIQLKEADLNENEKILTEFNARFGNVDIVQVIINDSNLLSYDQANLLSSYQCVKVLAFYTKAIRTFTYLQKYRLWRENIKRYII